MTFNPDQSLSTFVAGRVSDLIAGRRATWESIARAAGYKTAQHLRLMADGKAKMPLDKVTDYSRALEMDATDLMILAARQFLDAATFDLVWAAREREKQRRFDRALVTAIAVVAVSAATRERITETLTAAGVVEDVLEEALSHFDLTIAEVQTILTDLKNQAR